MVASEPKIKLNCRKKKFQQRKVGKRKHRRENKEEINHDKKDKVTTLCGSAKKKTIAMRLKKDTNREEKKR